MQNLKTHQIAKNTSASIMALKLYIQVILCLLILEEINTVLVDLTHSFNNQTQQWPSSTTMFSISSSIINIKNDRIMLEYYSASTHAGTHMDSPAHFNQEKWSIDQIPTSHLITPGIVINVTEEVRKDPDFIIQDTHILEWTQKNGEIPEKAVVLFNTGWAKNYNRGKEYFGSETLELDDLHFPGIGASAARWLVNNTSIVGVGIDTASIDPGQHSFESHIIFAAENVYMLENLASMDELPKKGFTLYAFPMKIEGGSGGACRVIASFGQEQNNACNVLHAVNMLVLLLSSFVFIIFN